MRRFIVVSVSLCLLTACDVLDPESASAPRLKTRGPALGAPSFQVSNSGVTITELVPAGSNWATGINDLGQVVGVILEREFIGFFWTNGVVTRIDSATVEAINRAGQAACNRYPPRACVWQNGVIRDLPTLGGTSSAAGDINDAGQIVGTSSTASGESHAVVWADDAITDIGVFAPVAINEAGQVAGTCGPPPGHACLWDHGTITDLGTLGGDRSSAADINSAGQIVGTSRTARGEQHGFVWASGTMTDLGDLGARYSLATAINDAGQIAGYGCLEKCDNGRGSDDVLHAFLLTNGMLTDLGTLGGTFSEPFDINEAGQVVGRSTPPGETSISELEMTSRTVLWQPNPDNRAPQVSAGPDQQADVGQPVSVTFRFPDATPNGAWTWSVAWGDRNDHLEEYTTTGTATTSDDPITVTHTYAEWLGGEFRVRVRVTDGEGGVGFDDVIVTVNSAPNTAPVVTAGADQQAWPGADVPTTFTFADSTPASPWTWRLDWGDGTASTGQTDTPRTLGASHVYQSAGRYTAELTVTDARGAAGSGALVVTITEPPAGNTAPAVSASGTNWAANGPVPWSFSYADRSTPAGPWAWQVVWGDGSTSSGASTTPSGTIQVTHTYAAAGDYAAVVTVSDNLGAAGSAAASFKIYPNQRPTLNAGADQQAEPGRATNLMFTVTDDLSGPWWMRVWTSRIDWGDGTLATGATSAVRSTPTPFTRSHTYTAVGRYTVSITFKDLAGAEGVDSMVMWVGATQWVEALVERINGLVTSGSLSQDRANGLLAKLREVEAKLDDAQNDQAANQLEAFINQVDSFVRAGVLAAEPGQGLVAWARDIISRLQGSAS